MTGNVLKIEAQALAWSASCAKSAAILLFDFAAAFPSIAHQWIFYVLEHMALPQGFLNVIRQLYTDCKSFITLCGQRFQSLLIESGIKQGCPLYTTIFAAAADPFCDV